MISFFLTIGDIYIFPNVLIFTLCYKKSPVYLVTDSLQSRLTVKPEWYNFYHISGYTLITSYSFCFYTIVNLNSFLQNTCFPNDHSFPFKFFKIKSTLANLFSSFSSLPSNLLNRMSIFFEFSYLFTINLLSKSNF